MNNKDPVYTGDLVEKYAGNLDKNEVGVVLAIAEGYDGKIYKVIVNDEVKNWYGEFIRKVARKHVA